MNQAANFGDNFERAEGGPSTSSPFEDTMRSHPHYTIREVEYEDKNSRI